MSDLPLTNRTPVPTADASVAATPVKHRRRWFQFSLRMLLIAMTMLCVSLGMIKRSVDRQRSAVRTVERLRGTVEYAKPLQNQSWIVRWLRSFLSTDYFDSVESVFLRRRLITDADLKVLDDLPHLKRLNLDCTQITDAGLVHLVGLSQLQSLSLIETKVTNAGLKHLQGLTQLQSLNLDRTLVTAAGLKHLRGLTQLQSLHLHSTYVTDAALISSWIDAMADD